MAPGFSVGELVAAARGGGARRLGLTRIAEGDWLGPVTDPVARARVFRDHPDSVTVRPGAAAAAREAARLTARCDDFATAAATIWEDLCILQPDAAGRYRLTAAAVGFPTDWRLADKMDLPLAAIHAPIPGYGADLSAGVDHVFATLRPGIILARANWFVVAGADWRYLPRDTPAERFAHVAAANAGDTLFVRCERQTLRRLPDSGAVLFTIGIALAPLGGLDGATVARIAGNVAGLSGGERERRAAPLYIAALTGYAASRTTELETQA